MQLFTSSRSLLAAVFILSSFGVHAASAPERPNVSQTAVAASAQSGDAGSTSHSLRNETAFKIATAPHSGTGRVDREIIRWQQKASESANPRVALERLGWAYVAKARASLDPGYYQLAGHCAACLLGPDAKNAEGLLLRGHVFHNLHRFKETETVARELCAVRGLSVDFALLGDALLELGRLNETVEAYQKMADLKPGHHAYVRIARLRWLKGDLAGALEMMRVAVQTAGSYDSETLAWSLTQLAQYELQAGDLENATSACYAAVRAQTDCAAALLTRGRLLLAQDRFAEAVEPLTVAAALNPIPEYQWTLAESLHATGRDEEAIRVESDILKVGPPTDPRTTALFLATRGEQIQKALRLAEHEITARADVFTHDALAWVLAAAGRLDEARQEMECALAEGTPDARLYFHAAVIASKAGHASAAKRWISKTRRQLLLPSERRELDAVAATIESEVARN